MVMTIFFLLAGLLGLYSLIALRQGQGFLQYVQEEVSRPQSGYAPPASLICPCKGLDPDLELNLRALLEQDYPDLEVLFVVAEESDPAFAVCNKLAGGSVKPARVIVAGLPEGRGEKVNNLEAGVNAARLASEALVFADSDGRPDAGWVRRLVAPLQDSSVGAATTFRWYIPDRDFLSGVQSAWNLLTGAYFMWEGRRRSCWGGGTALRRETFSEADVPRFWSGCISDDLMLSRALRKAGKEIRFVPGCLVATHHPTTWAGFFAWGTRQVTLMRVYETGTWLAGTLLLSFYLGVFLFGVVLAGVIVSGNPLGALMVLVTLAAIAGLMAAKGVYWLAAVQLMVPAHRKELQRRWWSPTLLLPFTPFLLAGNFLASMFQRRFTWRGVTYQLESAWRTRIVRRM
jgi:cellulose synthase/poly-beta-1,6-N-acetylglucosamine synthase-like glycosyltransferase